MKRSLTSRHNSRVGSQETLSSSVGACSRTTPPAASQTAAPVTYSPTRANTTRPHIADSHLRLPFNSTAGNPDLTEKQDHYQSSQLNVQYGEDNSRRMVRCEVKRAKNLAG